MKLSYSTQKFMTTRRMNIFYFVSTLTSISILTLDGRYVEVISDIIIKRDKAMITEFSCNKKGMISKSQGEYQQVVEETIKFSDSIKLVKLLTKNGYPSRILPVNHDDLEYPLPPNRQVSILNLECVNSSVTLENANKLNLFASPMQWILFSSTLSRMIIFEKYFSQIDILIESDVTLLHLEKNATISVQKIYRRHRISSVVVESIGEWNEISGFEAYGNETTIWRRRNDMKRTQLNACIVITSNNSLNHLTDKRDKHIDSIAKVNYVLVEHLADIVNVTLNYSVQSTWGYKNNKSEWSGMIGELMRNEADIGGTPLFVTIDRIDIIDYIAMTTPTRSKFVFREPKLSYVTNVYTLPFDDYVWASTISLVILIGLVLFTILKWEKTEKNNSIELVPHNVPDLQDTVSDVALLSIGAFCQQGAPSIPPSISGRITTILLFISLMFLYTSYSANIVALLQSSSSSIQTLEDLLKSRLRVGVDDTVFNRFYFPNSTETTRRAIYLQKVRSGKKEKFMTMEEGVREMRGGLFAFHMETGPGYKLVGEIFDENEKCGLKEIQYLQVSDPWLAIQKKSSYKKFLKIGLRKIQESGLQQREVSLIYTKKPICISRGSSFISVGLVDCYPAVVVLAGGLILATLVWLLELIYYRRYFLFQIERVVIKRKKKSTANKVQYLN